MPPAWDNLHEAMLSQSVASAALLDPDYAILRANKLFADHFGVGEQECAGRQFADLITDGALLDSLHEVARALRPSTADVRIRCGVGLNKSEPRDWKWSIAPVLNAVGELEALFLSGVDITELHRTEERPSTLDCWRCLIATTC